MSIRTQLYANNATATLLNPLAAGATSITLNSGGGAAFPSPAANQFFLATIQSGNSVEIIDIVGRTGDTLTVRTSPSSGRGMEGTTNATWGAGSTIECRTTAGTLAQFTRTQDRLGNIASVDLLTIPSASDGNSYICASPDDGGNPITAIYLSSTTWRFLTHPKVVVSSSVTSATTTTMAAAAIGTLSFATGKYIVQFTSGVNQGTARMITATSTGSITWTTAYSVAPSAADTFEIYQSAYSILNSSSSVADNSIIYSIIFGG